MVKILYDDVQMQAIEQSFRVEFFISQFNLVPTFDFEVVIADTFNLP